MTYPKSIFSLAIILLAVVYVNGMDCTLGTSENIIDKTINSCPRIYDKVLGRNDEEYCCFDHESRSVYCCDLPSFIVNSLGIILPIILLGILFISIITCCVCCICCPFCYCYKRRHAGRVLRTV